MKDSIFSFLISFLLLYSSFALAQLPNPVACFPFNGNANDASGNGHNGFVFGSSLTTDRFGNANCAYSFDGIDDYIFLGPYSAILPVGNEVTLSVWIQTDTVKPQTILMVNPDIFGDRFNAMAYYSHNGISTTFWDYGNCNTNGRLDSIGTAFNSGWEHYVYIVSDSLHYMEVYKNGIIQVSEPSNSTFINRNRDLRIGGGYDNNTVAFFFGGKIDDMMIFDQALTYQQVQLLYTLQQFCLSPTAIEESTVRSEIYLHPTYSNDGIFKLTVENNKSSIDYQVFDCLGNLIESTTAFSGQSDVNLNFSKLTKGLYLLNVKAGKIKKRIKFVIN